MSKPMVWHPQARSFGSEMVLIAAPIRVAEIPPWHGFGPSRRPAGCTASLCSVFSSWSRVSG